jgi:hypothetical protein
MFPASYTQAIYEVNHHFDAVMADASVRCRSRSTTGIEVRNEAKFKHET